jgi:hypothetical protein
MGEITVGNRGSTGGLHMHENARIVGSGTIDGNIHAESGEIEVTPGGRLDVRGSLLMNNLSGVEIEGTIALSGDFIFGSHKDGWGWQETSTLAMVGGVGAHTSDFAEWGALEIGGTDVGSDGDNAFALANFFLPQLVIGPGAHTYLVDTIDNSGDGLRTSDALYVDKLVFSDDKSVLNLNGLKLYYRTLEGHVQQIQDTLVGSSPGVRAVPEPSGVVASAVTFLFFGCGYRRRRRPQSLVIAGS